VTDAALQTRFRGADFYASFGTSPETVSPLENVYLKVFAVLHAERPSAAAETLAGWARVFPEDAVDLERVSREALLGQPLLDAPEVWLANDAFTTGTSLFDQYRGLPRAHTFDINAATALDWLTIPGVSPEIASQLLAGASYADLDGLLAHASLTPGLQADITSMRDAMTRLQARVADEEQTLSLWKIAQTYLWRLTVIVLAATIAGAWLARRAGVRRMWTATLIALGATLIVIAFAWIIISPTWYPFAAPAVVGGIPWGLWRIARRRALTPALQALAIWTLAALPALILTS
jgi:hypothetical protein